MHNEVAVRRHFLIAAVLILPGCVFNRSRPEVLLTAAAPDTVRLGDSVAVRVTVENISKRKLWFEGNHCFGVFQALNNIGEQVGSAYEGLVCAAYSIRVGIAPGTKHEHVAYWLGNSHALPKNRVSVPPGQYRIMPTIICCSVDLIKGWVHVRTIGSTITVIE